MLVWTTLCRRGGTSLGIPIRLAGTTSTSGGAAGLGAVSGAGLVLVSGATRVLAT